MQAVITKAQANQLLADGNVAVRHRAAFEARYNENLTIDLSALAEEGVTWLSENGSDLVRRKVTTYQRLMSNPVAKIGKLENIPTLMRSVLKDAPNKWFFAQEDGILVPYFTVSSEYSKGERDNPAFATLTMVAYSHSGQTSRSFKWSTEDISGKTIYDLLGEKNLVAEDDALVKEYRQQVSKYLKLRKLVGVQMLAKGSGLRMDGTSWEYVREAQLVDGQSTKIVLDEETPELKENRKRGSTSKSESVAMKFWSKTTDDEVEEVPYEVPTHPFLYVFSLRTHRWLEMHVDNLTDYRWSDDINDKLVLPPANKRLIRLLIENTGNNMADIIAGKSGGVIVLASGPPGVGKTLTAEVTSELLHKPLYSVQCSQLGTKEELIEERLGKVLARASRWGAVMLIDESDVYVRTRGEDIQQNAIVGVFLRTLEYYNGFLFLTTNRATTVDDAILSRLTAHVRYRLPNIEDRRTILKVQAEALGVELSREVIDHAVNLPLSGRDIRSVLKLARLVGKSENRPLDVDLLKFCLEYQDVTESSEENV